MDNAGAHPRRVSALKWAWHQGKNLSDRKAIKELDRTLEMLAARKPRGVLEIATAKGGSLFLFRRVVSDDALIIGLDMPYGRNGGGYPRWKEAAYRRFANPGQRLEPLRGNSHDAAPLAQVGKSLGGREIDFLMIDGDHSHEGVRMDFERYAPLASPEGLIALHDSLPTPYDPSISVDVFWREITATHRCEEIKGGRPGARRRLDRPRSRSRPPGDRLKRPRCHPRIQPRRTATADAAPSIASGGSVRCVGF
ncbi:class I SAM-dependent methyltransferase [Jannaschia seohaensis]|nr:class I SAM-dependent methyltransferase [Jannaschia seohaensis]